MTEDRVKILSGHLHKDSVLHGHAVGSGYRIVAEHFAEIDSTQVYLHEKKLSELLELNDPFLMYVASADYQSAGKGKGSRAWFHDRDSKSLALSLMFLIPESMLGESPFITQILAVSAIQVLPDFPLKIKWPNDLMLNHHKVGGIVAQLCDSRAMIIGIGINISTPNFVLNSLLIGSENRWPPTSLSSVSDKFVETKLLRRDLLEKFSENLNLFFANSINFINLVSNHQYLFNQEIQFRVGDTIWSGIHEGLDEKGGLKIKTKHGMKFFYSGEIIYM